MPDKQDTDQGTARPAVKRVRSDQDHSKGDTKKREDQRQGDDGHHGGGSDGEGGDGDGEEHTDEDWLYQAPFRQSESLDGWETVWRQSSWCGKGMSHLAECGSGKRRRRDVADDAVAFVYDADPLQAKFCHCEDCQRLHGEHEPPCVLPQTGGLLTKRLHGLSRVQG